jgi:hypothetical protein
MRRASLVLHLLAAIFAPVALWGATPDFRSAQSVETFRVAPRYEKTKTTGKTFREQKVISGPRPLPLAPARAVTEQLQQLYGKDRPPTRCAFVARYGLRVRLPRETVEVLVCPHCGEVEFFARNRRAKSSVSSPLLDTLRKTFSDHPLCPDEG